VRFVLLAFLALQLACDLGVTATYRVSMGPAEADSITQLSVAIADAIAQQRAMEVTGTNHRCSLASYYKSVGNGDWWDLCVTRVDSTAVRFHLEAWRSGEWGSRGDELRDALRDTLTTQFGARFSEEVNR